MNDWSGGSRSRAKGGIRNWARVVRGALAMALVGSGLAACTDLIDIDPNVCGNAVLDAAEDCDGHDDAASKAHCALPEEQHACRFVCDATAKTPACPEGYACGADGVCGRPSNRFIATTLFDSIGGDVVALGDFDGDTVTDLALMDRAAQTLRVELMAPGLVPGAEQVLPAEPTNALTAGLVDLDGRADLVQGSQGALSSLTAAEGRRELVGTAFASYIFSSATTRVIAAPSRAVAYPTGVAVDVLQPDADVEGVLLGTDDTQIYLRNPYNGLVVGVPVVPRSLATLGSPTRAPMIDRTGSVACDELVLPYHASGAKGGAVVVYPLCDDGGAAIYPTDLCVGLCPATIESADDVDAVFPVEVDGDPGRELLVVHTSIGSVDKRPTDLTMIEQSGGGLENVPLLGHLSLENLRTFLTTTDTELLGRVLLIADLNGDGELDVVGAHGVYLHQSEPPSFYRAAAPLTDTAWSEAVAADFNGDGRLDVAASPVESSDLDLLLGTAGSYFNPTVLPTAGHAGLLTAGDYDGDAVSDLAFREHDPEAPTANIGGVEAAECSAPDDIIIRFGGQSGLGDRTIVARAAGILQMIPGKLPRLDKRDSIEDFGAVLQCASDGKLGSNRVSVFYGALSRQVAAPFLLHDQLDNPHDSKSPSFLVPYQPRATTTAVEGTSRLVATIGTSIPAFRPSAALKDYSTSSVVALFVLETDDDGVVFGKPHFIPMIQKAGAIDTLGDASFHLAMGDINGKDTAVGDQDVLVTVGSTLYIVKNWVAYGEDSDLKEGVNPAEDVVGIALPGPASDLLVTDLDGDGIADAVVGGTTKPAAPGEVGVPYLTVLFGGESLAQGQPTAQLSLDVGETRVAALGALPLYEAGSLIPAQHALIYAGGKTVGAETIQFVTISPKRAASKPNKLVEKQYSHVNDLAVADIDGDRFDDVVVLTPTNTEVISRLPTLAGDEQVSDDKEVAQ